MSRIQNIGDNYEKLISYENYNQKMSQKYNLMNQRPILTGGLSGRTLRGFVTYVNDTNLSLICLFAVPSEGSQIQIFDGNNNALKGEFTVNSVNTLFPINNLYIQEVQINVSPAPSGINFWDIFQFVATTNSVWLNPPPSPFPIVYGIIDRFVDDDTNSPYLQARFPQPIQEGKKFSVINIYNTDLPVVNQEYTLSGYLRYSLFKSEFLFDYASVETFRSMFWGYEIVDIEL